MINGLRFDFTKLSARFRFLIYMYIIGFTVGVTTHAIDLINGGFLPYNNVPLWKNIYWTSLTVLDLAVIIILLIKTKWGLILANLIMITDVMITTELFAIFNNYKIFMQIFFFIFIIVTTPLVFKEIKRCTKATYTQHMV